MLNVIAIILILLTWSGCTKVQPHVIQYRINVDFPQHKYKTTPCAVQSLKVSQSSSSNLIMLEDMSYVIGQYEIEQFTQSGWVASPNRAITNETMKMLESTNIFQNINNSKSKSKSALILETNIEEFMQYFSQDEKSSFVGITIKTLLFDAKTKKSISWARFSKKRDVKNINAKSGVVALNKSLKEILEEEKVWLYGVCQ